MMGVDQYTKLLLHCNGADGSTTFIDEAGNTVYPQGAAQIDTAQFKFGGASALLGVSNYLTISDSDDWQLDGGSNSNEWTLESWVRFNGDPGTGYRPLISQVVNNQNYWNFGFGNNNLIFSVTNGGSLIIDIQKSWNPADATWYHLACVKQGATGYKMFVNGSQIGTTQTDTDTIPNFAASLRIGQSLTSYMNGWMDEIRVSKGVARWTANFTPPSAEYKSGFKPKIIMM